MCAGLPPLRSEQRNQLRNVGNSTDRSSNGGSSYEYYSMANQPQPLVIKSLDDAIENVHLQYNDTTADYNEREELDYEEETIGNGNNESSSTNSGIFTELVR